MKTTHYFLVLVFPLVAFWIGCCACLDDVGNFSAANKCIFPNQFCLEEDEANFDVEIPENFTTSTYFIDLKVNHSIINFTVIENVTITETGELTVTLFEDTHLMKSWILKLNQNSSTPSLYNYISRTSHLKIDVSIKGNGSQNGIRFSYREIPFDVQMYNVTEDSGSVTQDGKYRPNRITIYHFESPEQMNESSITITLKYLDIDVGVGEYFLIGAGKHPMQGPPALFVAIPRNKPKDYVVADQCAYIIFAARTRSRAVRGFHFSWSRSGIKIGGKEGKVEEPTPDAVLQSMPICFYNSSYISEFNGLEDDELFPKFREKLAEIAYEYARERKISLLTDIKASSVRIYRVSNLLPPDPDREDLQNGVIFVMIKIVQRYESKIAVFRWWQLEEILRRYDEYDAKTGHALMGFKIGECPVEVHYTSWGLGVFILVAAFFLFFLGIWLWRYNIFWKSHRFKTMKQRSDQHLIISRDSLFVPSSGENDYVKPPKIRLTTADGHSRSLKSDGSAYKATLSEEESDVDEIFNIVKPGRRRSYLPDFKSEQTPTHPLQTLTFESRPEGERNRLWQNSMFPKMLDNHTTQNETERVYECIASSIDFEHFRKDDETKL